MTIFVRLLDDDDKASSLRASILALESGSRSDNVYDVVPATLRDLPGTPFAYWAIGDMKRLFSDLPRFESENRSIRTGASTMDDFRWLRLWWECAYRERSNWVPIAKGGEYSPYYSDISLVVDWRDDGNYLGDWKFAARPREGHRWGSMGINADLYSKPGVTWPRRTSGLSVRALPRGCVFSDKGPTVFHSRDNIRELSALRALMNSRPFYYLVQLMLARVSLAQSYESGIIQQMPFPVIDDSDTDLLDSLATEAGEVVRKVDSANEHSHNFVVPALLHAPVGSIAERFDVWTQALEELSERFEDIGTQIDDVVFSLYGISDIDQQAIQEALVAGPSQSNSEDDLKSARQRVEALGSEANSAINLVQSFISYSIGCAVGRWDIRLAVDHQLRPALQGQFDPLPTVSPGTLTDSVGAPAQSGEIAGDPRLRARTDARDFPFDEAFDIPAIDDDIYPLEVEWDGILVFDPQHRNDIVRHIREVLAIIWPDGAGEIEQQACKILGVGELRDYLSSPRRFFDFHLKQYSKSRRKAPIYWPLSTVSGSYTIWLYYPRLTSDTIYSAVNKYLNPKIASIDRSIADLRQPLAEASGGVATRLQRDLESEQELRRELIDMREELLRIAALPYRPNLDDGVIINAAPFHRLFRHRAWARATEDTWKKLEKGDYDWAHLAYAIWPDRVRDVCRTDKSIAIAHELEDLYVEPPATAKKGKGRARQRALAEEDA